MDDIYIRLNVKQRHQMQNIEQCCFFFRPLREVYHLWRLAGGDMEGELKKRGLIKTKPPIMTLPMYVISSVFTFFFKLIDNSSSLNCVSVWISHRNYIDFYDFISPFSS